MTAPGDDPDTLRAEIVELRARTRALEKEITSAARQLPRLRQMVEYSTDLMFLLDPDGLVLDCNRAATERLGQPRGALHGLAFDTVCKTPIDQVLTSNGNGQPKTMLAELIHRDGETFAAELDVGTCITHGETVHAISARDITERKVALAKQMHVDRNATIGTLAASVAHEVNNPLTWIIGNIEHALMMAEEPDASVEEQQEILSLALDGAIRVRDVVRDLRIIACNDDSHGPSCVF